MGKTSRPFPTGHFRLNPKKNASDDTPLVIQLEYVVKGRPIRRSTGYTVKPTDWDKKSNKGRGGVKASYGADYRNMNQRLTKLVDSTDERLEGLEDEGYSDMKFLRNLWKESWDNYDIWSPLSDFDYTEDVEQINLDKVEDYYGCLELIRKEHPELISNK